MLCRIRPSKSKILLLSICTLASFLVVHLLYLQESPDYSSYIADAETPLESHAGRSVRFHQVTGVGFNNQLQEVLLLSALAARANRTYVHHELSFRNTFGRLRYAPLRAFAKQLPSAVSVSEKQWRASCGDSVKTVAVLPAEDGEDVFAKATEMLSLDETDCVQVDDWLTHWQYLESEPVLSIWPHFAESLLSFRWSTEVDYAIDRTLSRLGLEDPETYMAIHLRRGDFTEHCTNLIQNNHPFMLWNRLSGLPDPLSQTGTADTSLRRCFPTQAEILAKILTAVTDHRASHPSGPSQLTTLYILHDMQWNTPAIWLLLRALTTRLLAASPHAPAPFTRVLHTSDARAALAGREADFAVMVDLEIARRAAVFVGNGYSSLTSDVTMFRLADGKVSASIRFW